MQERRKKQCIRTSLRDRKKEDNKQVDLKNLEDLKVS